MGSLQIGRQTQQWLVCALALLQIWLNKATLEREILKTLDGQLAPLGWWFSHSNPLSSQVPRMSCTGPFKGGPGGAHFDDMQSSFWGQGPCGSRSHLPPLRGLFPNGGSVCAGEATGPHRRGDSCGPGRQLLPRKVPPRRGRDPPLGLITNIRVPYFGEGSGFLKEVNKTTKRLSACAFWGGGVCLLGTPEACSSLRQSSRDAELHEPPTGGTFLEPQHNGNPHAREIKQKPSKHQVHVVRLRSVHATLNPS